jgi:Ala-tRNA(Pro) deacylase
LPERRWLEGAGKEPIDEHARGKAMTVGGVTRELDQQQVSYEVIPHQRTQTAREEATAVGVAPSEVAKTLVLATEEGFVRAVVPASEKLDLTKARALVGGGKHTRLASEAELGESYPMFELGAVPPFGGPTGDRVIVDVRLAEHDFVVLDAGSHSESVRLRTSDLLILARAEIADLCRD